MSDSEHQAPQLENKENAQQQNLSSSHVIVEEEKSTTQDASLEIVNDKSGTITNQNEVETHNPSETDNQAKVEQASVSNDITDDIPVGASHMDSISSAKEDMIAELNEQNKESSPQPATSTESDLSDRYIQANALKESAKFFVNGKLYNDAIKIYESAFQALRPTHKDVMHPQFKNSIELQIDLLNNLSFCYENLERYHDSIAYAKRVLIFDNLNPKALFRLANGNKNLGNNEEAYDQVKQAIEGFKLKNPDQALDPKIHSLYLELKEICKPLIEERENKQKTMYSKMLGTSKESFNSSGVEKNNKKDQKEIDPLKWKPIRYGLYLGPSIILGTIAFHILKRKSVEVAKNNIPAILTAAGAIFVLSYIKNHARKSILSLGLAVAAALMIQRGTKSGFWKAN